jgi:hypothetical protein
VGRRTKPAAVFPGPAMPPSVPEGELLRQTVVGRRAAGKEAKDLANKQRWGRAPGLWFNGTILAAMVLVLAASTTPTMADWGYPFVVFLVVMFFFWVPRVRWRNYAPRPTGWRTNRRWFAVPFIAGCVMVGLLFADVPFHVRFAMSRSKFNTAAARIHETATDHWVPVSGGSVAGFPISEARRVGRQVWFRYSGDSADVLDFKSRYIAFLPDGPNDRTGCSRNLDGELCHYYSSTSLGGGWYYVHDWAD